MRRPLLLGLAVVLIGIGGISLFRKSSPFGESTPETPAPAPAASHAEIAPPPPGAEPVLARNPDAPRSDLSRFSELVTRSQDESKLCRSQLEDAKRLLGSSLGQAIQTLAKLPVAPRATQEGMSLIARSPEVAHGAKNDRFFTEASALQTCDPAGQLDFVRDLIAAVKADGRPELRQALSEALVEYFSRDADRPNTLVMDLIRIHLLQNAVDGALLPAEFRPQIAHLQSEIEQIHSLVRQRNQGISNDDPDGLIQSYVAEIHACEPFRKHYAEFAERLRPISTGQSR